MMTPSPRGFPRSVSGSICEHVRMAHKPSRRPLSDRWKAEAEKDGTDAAPFDLCAVFDLPSLRNDAVRVKARTITPLAVCGTVSTETRDFWIAFNPPQFHVKKDGTAKQRKMKVTLITATVMIQSGTAAPVAVFRASNRGATILDHRTGQRRPLCEVSRDVVRLLGADAAPITDTLAALQPGDRPAKARPPGKTIVPTGVQGITPQWEAKRHRQPSAEAAPLTDKQIEELSDEDFAAHLAGTFAAMDVIGRAGTPEFYARS
jgi:hypothetical protein